MHFSIVTSEQKQWRVSKKLENRYLPSRFRLVYLLMFSRETIIEIRSFVRKKQERILVAGSLRKTCGIDYVTVRLR